MEQWTGEFSFTLPPKSRTPEVTRASSHRYESAVVAMAKQKVTLEVLSYHATAPKEEALKLRVGFKNQSEAVRLNQTNPILQVGTY